MTCINWVRVRKGARPARFAAGDRAEGGRRTIAACVTGSWSIFLCLFVLFCYSYFYQGSPNRPKFKEERAGVDLFLSFLMENSWLQPGTLASRLNYSYEDKPRK